MCIESLLKIYRFDLAARERRPIYNIFSDSVIRRIALAAPRDMASLQDVPGLPPKFCEEHGEAVLASIARLPPAKRPRHHAHAVYILELARGRVYVGKTCNTEHRTAQHLAGSGSAFTRAFPPTGKKLPRLGNVSGGGDAAERDETLRYMYLRGPENVRGWRFTGVELSPRDIADAEREIRELFDLCRRCGHGGHFIENCCAKTDRRGKPIPHWRRSVCGA